MRRLAAPALFLAVLSLYWPVSRHDFINFDDDTYLTRNTHVQAGLSLAGVKWALQPTEVAFWRPITWFSHMVDVQLFGLDAGAHHLVNVFFHAANAVLLLHALSCLTGAFGRSLVVAALFAFHPLNVETVAWAAERKEVLATCFGLLTLLAYRRYVGRPGRGRYLAVVAFLALGLMSKATLVTLPLLLLLIDFWPLGRLAPALPGGGAAARVRPAAWPLVIEKAPLLLLSVLSSAVTYLSVHRIGGIASLQAVPFGFRLLRLPLGYVSYLGKLAWPSNLAIFYPAQRPPGPAAVLAAVAALGVLGWLAFLHARRRPYLLVGYLWFLVALVPVIGLVQAGTQWIADHYVYVPAVGLFVAVAWGAWDLARASRRGRPMVALAAAAAVLAAAGIARARHPAWRDSVTLFTSALEHTEGNWLAHNNLGLALVERKRYAEARQHLAEALRIAPDLQPAAFGMGIALAGEGRAAEAESWYRRALTLDADQAGVWYFLGLALVEQGRTGEAIDALENALHRAPEHVDAHYNLGVALMSLGRIEEAIGHYREAVRLRPGDRQARINLGIALRDSGAQREAEEQFRAAARLQAQSDAARVGRQ